MSSFFDKLKAGMGEPSPTENLVNNTADDSAEEKVSETPDVPETIESKAKPKKKRRQKTTKDADPVEMISTISVKEISMEEEPEQVKTFSETDEEEGELAVDIFQNENFIVIQSAIAGIKPENLNISMEKEIITIKGRRDRAAKETGDYLAQECHWGAFSRQISLPEEINPNAMEATMKDGILTIKLPKLLKEKKRLIQVKNC